MNGINAFDELVKTHDRKKTHNQNRAQNLSELHYKTYQNCTVKHINSNAHQARQLLEGLGHATKSTGGVESCRFRVRLRIRLLSTHAHSCVGVGCTWKVCEGERKDEGERGKMGRGEDVRDDGERKKKKSWG
jgi:hypothetical protein